jgi:hypothetical protein
MHSSAWKGYSPNFAQTAFQEIRQEKFIARSSPFARVDNLAKEASHTQKGAFREECGFALKRVFRQRRKQMRRAGVFLVAAALLLALSAGAALAKNFIGTSGPDTIRGTDGPDFIDGKAGNDRLFGRDGRDTIMGRDGADLIKGGRGPDRLVGGPGADTN